MNRYLSNSTWFFNEDIKVRLLKDNRIPPWNDGFTVRIELLEPYSQRTRNRLFTYQIGSVLQVGYWQVRNKPWKWEEIQNQSSDSLDASTVEDKMRKTK